MERDDDQPTLLTFTNGHGITISDHTDEEEDSINEEVVEPYAESIHSTDDRSVYSNSIPLPVTETLNGTYMTPIDVNIN